MEKKKTGEVVLNLQELELFVQKWDVAGRPKGILLIGNTGHGKTTTMKKVNWNYTYPNGDTRSGFHNMRFLPGIYEKTECIISADQLTRCIPSKQMCFDDLGAERDTAPYGKITNLMELIIDQYPHASYTTNLTPPQILEKYGERVLSRLKQQCYFIILKDKDFRSESLNKGIDQLL